MGQEVSGVLVNARQFMERHQTPLLYLSAALLGVLAMWLGLSWFVLGDYTLFWDFRVYTAAMAALARGENPYDPTVLHALGAPEFLYFTSPPAVAGAMQVLAQLGLSWLYAAAIILLHIAAMIATPVMLTRLLFGEGATRASLGVGVFFAMFTGAGVFTLAVLNNGTPLYAFIVLAACQGFKTERWRLFHVAVVLATIFKPFYLVLWVIPVLAKGFSWRQAFIGAGCAIAALSTYLLAYVLTPEMFASWWEMLTRQVLADGSRGDSLFAFVSGRVGEDGPSWAGYAAHFAYMGAIVALLLMTRVQGPARWALLLAAGIVLNPRIMVYDKVIAAIPLVYLGALIVPWRMQMGARLALSALGLVFGVVIATMVLGLPSSLINSMLALVLIAGVALRIGPNFERSVPPTGLEPVTP
jgi:hypothetical protein